MKNKIITIFGIDKITHKGFYSDEIHIVDYTERTGSKRAVEVHCVEPTDIDSLMIMNPRRIHITASIFKPQCFIGDDGNELKQCECVLYPTNTNDSWVMFVEIKDCKPKNASNYYQDIKDKFIVNVKLFRDKGIIEQNKVVYAIASFTRKGKTNFHNHLIKAAEWKDFRDKHKIMVKGTNKITIKNTQIIN